MIASIHRSRMSIWALTLVILAGCDAPPPGAGTRRTSVPSDAMTIDEERSESTNARETASDTCAAEKSGELLIGHDDSRSRPGRAGPPTKSDAVPGFATVATTEAFGQTDVQNGTSDNALRQDVATLKDKAPDQSHAMSDVDYHFSNLWFAARARNWPLAEFYWKESLSHLKWAVRIIPVRKDKAGQEIKLQDILQSIENSPFMQIGKTIEAKDLPEFEKAYRFTLEGCYSCHKAVGKPYLRPRIPEQPASRMINFDPDADWPK